MKNWLEMLSTKNGEGRQHQAMAESIYNF